MEKLPISTTVRDSYRALTENGSQFFRVWSLFVPVVGVTMANSTPFPSVVALLASVSIIFIGVGGANWQQVVAYAEARDTPMLSEVTLTPRRAAHLGLFVAVLAAAAAAAGLFFYAAVFLGNHVLPSAGFLPMVVDALIGIGSITLFWLVLCRFALCLPAVAAFRFDEPARTAFRLSHGSTLRIFGGSLACFLPGYLLLTVVSLGLGYLAAHGGQAPWLMRLIVVMVWLFVASAVLSVTFAFFTLALMRLVKLRSQTTAAPSLSPVPI